ncbi:MAG: sulfite exporter TauE/SafE family protein [Candidatus Omnitrophica bacterium]|nr:sulfite exporter TauE/SafE family protein [Candidatus Omnitrophota bacterium]
MTFILLAGVGLVSGFLGGLLGVGGGVILVPLFYYLLGLKLTEAIGTSLAVIIPTAAAASITHAQLKHIHFKTALFTALFAVAGAIWGASLTDQFSTPLIRRLFALVLAVTAVKLFMET